MIVRWTTLTTIVGMLPLAVGMGAGANLMQPLAVGVIGGLLGAMLLTLILVPCLYVVVQSASVRLRSWLRSADRELPDGASQAPAPQPPAGG